MESLQRLSLNCINILVRVWAISQTQGYLMYLIYSEDKKYPIVLENVLGFRSVHVEGLAVTGFNSGWSSNLSMKEIIPLCLVQRTHKISPELD